METSKYFVNVIERWNTSLIYRICYFIECITLHRSKWKWKQFFYVYREMFFGQSKKKEDRCINSQANIRKYRNGKANR